ncbi:uncharacterized protein TRIVIDRAFT_78410 [Trichoderma virens Gv29-8]|uniref:Regulator of phospholipase D SRF1 n=1 Tax=Hypocrea virens (strain Gv29-8 / FGSC 10586) TaxID=413071 RepID=G9MW52_HYPVG|nr:uncharacterized protein TRIVIDRAFT_78410 [Trichoderma virens Gv29-8]EHK21348.1 hypothetical protein TRIVIDRAFT_78410 [Trichoderma virens Gv29-8]UKZ73686.1 hypothetical protein TrVFT333_001336 [Trichoderma virens FT-333]
MASPTPEAGSSTLTPSSPTPASASTSSSSRPAGSDARQRPVRTIPPWVAIRDDRNIPIPEEQLRLLNPPQPSAVPQRNGIPQPPQRRLSKDGYAWEEDPKLGSPQDQHGRIPHLFKYGRASARGRKWDHLRSAEPVIVSAQQPAYGQPSTSWAEFIRSSAWGRPQESHIVDIEALNHLQPGYARPLDEMLLHLPDNKHDRRDKSALSKRLWNRFMRSSLSPLLFRLTVIVMSVIALGIAARMFDLEDKALGESAERTQSIFAIAVDSVAIPFNGYMIYDEYTGKPLGLRSARSKMSLILLDLFFIIFKSAGTALAFEHVVYHTFGDHIVRGLAKGLATFMLLGLLAWTANLCVNIFRVVERLGGGDDERM